MTANKWSIPLGRLASRTGKRLEDGSKRLIYLVCKDIGERSPVDTGRFRSNWNISFQRPNYATTTNTDTRRSEAQAKLVLDRPLANVTFYANGLPYGPRLEFEGWSKQAPQGMVRLAAASAPRRIKETFR